MKKITVDLAEKSYSVYIGKNLLKDEELLQNNIDAKKIMVITNATIAPLYLSQVMQLLPTADVDSLVIPDGEQYKTLDTFNEIITKLLQGKFGRDGCLVALGGGVIGDLTGFAAACYQRGIDFIQLPTTVLAQVDSSLGGKTGVNHVLGKNMIGAFHQPKAVIADIAVLATLNDREFKAGLAEVIKYGLIRDTAFFHWLEQNTAKLLAREPGVLAYAIEQSCKNKIEIFTADEREAGLRAILNLGHTFGHAIETGFGYSRWLHGEAVALGMLMAADLSYQLGWLAQDVVTRIRNILAQLDLPVAFSNGIDASKMRELMAVDKKSKDGTLYLVLLKDIGEPIITNEFSEDLLRQTLERFITA